ncbi:hypothetical protein N0V90_010629 [Kalmusia sp. IMI 367209]|nr:hypothetical protein N0V90_010629 [Kalmusia sp. IMI 367209]
MSAPTHEAVVTILYKRTDDFKFDVEYFLTKHVPIVKEAWKPHGLLGATISEATPDSEIAYINAIRFQTLEGVQKVLADQEKLGPLMADIPNFTNGQPVFVVGKVVEGGHIDA